MDRIISMYITMLAPILAGIANMLWCKLKVAESINKPIDFGLVLKDGQRLFGEHKTWKGFAGYIGLNVVMSVLNGWICSVSPFFFQHNFLYVYHENILSLNVLVGILLGLGYALAELPNSFLKRRLNSVPGKPVEGKWRLFFTVLDQADSVIGCVTVLAFFYPMGIGMFLFYIFLGALTHMLLNVLLYLAHLRKNPL